MQLYSRSPILQVPVEFAGADNYFAPYNCSVPGYVTTTGKEGLVNASGKVTFVCTYTNASTAPMWLTFQSNTAAQGEHS